MLPRWRFRNASSEMQGNKMCVKWRSSRPEEASALLGIPPVLQCAHTAALLTYRPRENICRRGPSLMLSFEFIAMKYQSWGRARTRDK
jgi:hypothetical protein